MSYLKRILSPQLGAAFSQFITFAGIQQTATRCLRISQLSPAHYHLCRATPLTLSTASASAPAVATAFSLTTLSTPPTHTAQTAPAISFRVRSTFAHTFVTKMGGEERNDQPSTNDVGAHAKEVAREVVSHPSRIVGGTKVLDESVYDRVVEIRALRIPAKACKEMMTRFKHNGLNIPRFRNIVHDPDEVVTDGKPTNRLLLLCPSIKTLKDLPEAHQQLVAKHAAVLIDYKITLGFDYWTADQILRASLPKEIDEVTSSFETIGHIAHMNLRRSQLEYKTIFGEVILRKNKGIRTVVNKLQGIENIYRNFQMEIIAGENDFNTTVRESGCVFKMRFDKVYWNSRLHFEHERIIKKMKKGDVVYDMFGGIGPFALPAGKKECVVYANDLNPDSYKALCVNVDLNKVSHYVKSFNMDGRDFMRKMVLDSQSEDLKVRVPDAQHVLMNLPASAHEFLDVFNGLYAAKKETMTLDQLPTIHCYCFSSAEDLVSDALRMCEEELGGKIIQPYSVHEVRDVAPKKRMMCVSFKLSAAVAFSTSPSQRTTTATPPTPTTPPPTTTTAPPPPTTTTTTTMMTETTAAVAPRSVDDEDDGVNVPQTKRLKVGL